MIAIRHTGIYVDDIVKLEKFYMSVFGMIPVCSGEPDQSSLFDELLCQEGVRIITTKLITLYGKKNGQGDMLELVKVLGEVGTIPKLPDNYPISMTGMAHIAFQIDDMQKTVEQIQEGGGFQKTDIYQMKRGNLCCFCRDPERNWIELIQRRKEDMDKLKGKTALITGGTSGIGGYCPDFRRGGSKCHRNRAECGTRECICNRSRRKRT